MLLPISGKRAAKAEAKKDKPVASRGPETSMTARSQSNASLSDIAEDLGRTASAARAHAMRIALGRSRFIMKSKAK
jgi:predicted transcriptional regulator